MILARAKGKALTAIGCMYGVRRRWFGLEPDFLYRPRLLAALTAKPPRGAGWPAC